MIDLHCHTTASDGLITPDNLIRQAVIEGISVIAIADHDTVNGLEEAIRGAKIADIGLIPAIELSVDYTNGIFHLLGYGIQYENREFRDKLIWLKRVREERILRIIEKLKHVGVELTHGDVQNELNGDAPGKSHVARALVKKGYAPNVSAALKTYLNRGAPGYVVKEKIHPESAFELIKSAGGFPVLAHPKSLNCDGMRDYDRFIQRYTSLGLAGIEVYASIHDDEDVAMFGDIAQRHHLIATGGSDFHGDNGSRLGYYGDCRPIPDSCSQPLLQLIEH